MRVMKIIDIIVRHKLILIFITIGWFLLAVGLSSNINPVESSVISKWVYTPIFGNSNFIFWLLAITTLPAIMAGSYFHVFYNLNTFSIIFSFIIQTLIYYVVGKLIIVLYNLQK